MINTELYIDKYGIINSNREVSDFTERDIQIDYRVTVMRFDIFKNRYIYVIL